MASSLYTAHSRPLTVLYSEIERQALDQPKAFTGTAGSVIERMNAGKFRFYARSYYDADGRKREEYLAGPVGDAAADAAAADLRARIKAQQALNASLRLLGREGFNLVDAKTYGTLASVSNHGFFTTGGLLVGSHAYGVLLNQLGVRAAAYATEDIDLARNAELAIDSTFEGGLLAMLREPGIEFVEIPRLDKDQPSTSFKERGRSRFHVDLLVPSPTESFPVVAVPELHAHATGLPYLGFLLEPSYRTALASRGGCCAVRVPTPERFAVHKLVVSQLRVERGAKAEKDVHQASVLAAVLAETHPGALTDAIAELPKRALRHFTAGRASARRHLEHAHPRAWEELNG
ncbi:MAG TPA: GSU2403 family nucleotidyltransferase fold protein [Polyangia bacterium]|nr:GSU2403 family nucleotidyltransferase fold protein [Polyangia bacterium]